MDGYEILADSYEQMQKVKRMQDADKETLKVTVDALRTVSGKNEQFINSLYATGAFNDITIGYLKAALQTNGIDAQKAASIIDDYKHCLDTISAADARKQ